MEEEEDLLILTTMTQKTTRILTKFKQKAGLLVEKGGSSPLILMKEMCASNKRFSGISIENPDSRRSVPGGNTVKEILQRAAQCVRYYTRSLNFCLTKWFRAGPPPVGQLGFGSTPFRGGGHTLGSDDVESTYIPDPDADSDGMI